MSEYVPHDDSFPLNDTAFSHYIGCWVKFVGPALLMVTLKEGKDTISHEELWKVVMYIINEGILTEEHKAWLAKNNKKIQFFVLNSNHQKLEQDMSGIWMQMG